MAMGVGNTYVTRCLAQAQMHGGEEGPDGV